MVKIFEGVVQKTFYLKFFFTEKRRDKEFCMVKKYKSVVQKISVQSITDGRYK
jgi:hypothetical protein